MVTVEQEDVEYRVAVHGGREIQLVGCRRDNRRDYVWAYKFGLQLAERTAFFSINLEVRRREKNLIANVEGVFLSMPVSIAYLAILDCEERIFGYRDSVLPLNEKVFG